MAQQINGNDCLLNVVVIGDSFVGKSKIIERFTKNEFSFDGIATIGLDFGTKTLQIDGNKVKARIWDTSGLASYRTINYMYYRKVDGAVIVYDTTRKSSFEGMKKWLRELRSHARSDTVVIIIGNKCDSKCRREVREDEVREFADKEGVLFMEVSAREGVNVEEAFCKLISQVYCTKMNRSKFGLVY
ncbi:hypothetical protein LUZ60_012920 [Juncus effusus]|nr:hypothetical protein LUZ60_012920 [Juncus effusus]